jgi:hypothetical protein
MALPTGRYGSFSGKSVASYGCVGLEVCYVSESGRLYGGVADTGGLNYNPKFFDPENTVSRDLRPILGFVGSREVQHIHIECVTGIHNAFDYASIAGFDCINQVEANLTIYDRWEYTEIIGGTPTQIVREYTSTSVIRGNHSFARTFYCGAGIGQPSGIRVKGRHEILELRYFSIPVVFDAGEWHPVSYSGPGHVALDARGETNPFVLTYGDQSYVGPWQDYECYFNARCLPPQTVAVSLKCFDDYGNNLPKRMIALLGGLTIQDPTYTDADLADYIFAGNSPVSETRSLPATMSRSQFYTNESGPLIPSFLHSVTQEKVSSSRNGFVAALGSNCFEDDPTFSGNFLGELNFSRNQRAPYVPIHKMTPSANVTDRLIYTLNRVDEDIAPANSWATNAEFGGTGSVTGSPPTLAVTVGTVRFDLQSVPSGKNDFGFRYMYLELTSGSDQTVLFRLSAGDGSDYENLEVLTGTHEYEIDILNYQTAGSFPRFEFTATHTLGAHFKLTAGQSITVESTPRLAVKSGRFVRQRGESRYSYDSIMRVDALGIIHDYPDPTLPSPDWPDEYWHISQWAAYFYTSRGWAMVADNSNDVIAGWYSQKAWETFPLSGVDVARDRKAWESGSPYLMRFSVIGKSIFAMPGNVWNASEAGGALRLDVDFIWGNGIGATIISGATRQITSESVDTAENPWPTPWSTSFTPSTLQKWGATALPYSDPNTTIFVDPDYFTREFKIFVPSIGDPPNLGGGYIPGDAYWVVIDGDSDPVAVSMGMDNVGNLLGYYAELLPQKATLEGKFVHHSFPDPNWDREETVTVSECGYPAICQLPGGRLVALYRSGVPETVRRFSDDHGLTWGDESMAFDANTIWMRNGYEPHEKFYWEAGFDFDVPSSGPGTISAHISWDMGATFEADFVLKDSTATNLAIADNGFGITFIYDGQRRFMLVCLIDGETEPSRWYSTDRLQTWTRVT